VKDTITSEINGLTVTRPVAVSEKVKRELIRLAIYLCRNGHKREKRDGTDSPD
jgi:hypothetical protein